jgi:hypothetical protein
VGSFVTICTVIGFVTLLGLILTSIAPFIEESDANHLRSRFETFWISIADLTTPEQVGTALRALRRHFRQRIPIFLKLFWSCLCVMFIIVCWENSSDAVHSDYTQAIEADFTLVANMYYLEIAKGENVFCNAHRDICTDMTGNEWRNELTRVALLEDSYHDLVEQLYKNNPVVLIVIGDLSVFLVLVTLAVPLSVSLLASFNVTLWLLSRVTSSAIRSLTMIVLDICVAVLAPLLTDPLIFRRPRKFVRARYFA